MDIESSRRKNWWYARWIFSYHGAPLQNGKRQNTMKICTWIWTREDPCRSTWRGYRRKLCGTGDSTKYSSHWAMVANPTSRFESVLSGLWRMSTDWETIAKGWNAPQSTDDAAAIRRMGNRLCGAHHTSREDGCALYHHYDRVLDSMGGSIVG